MKEKWRFFASVVQLAAGVLAIAGYLLLAQKGEVMSKWTATLFFGGCVCNIGASGIGRMQKEARRIRSVIMKYASDFRAIARKALGGNWVVAVIAGLLAALLGGVASNGPEIKLNISESGAHVVFEFAGQQLYTSAGGWYPGFTGLLIGGAAYIIVITLILAAVYFVLGSVIEVGYARFNLTLIDREKEPELNTVFSCFAYWKTTALAKFLQGVYVFLWSLLLIIPGILAGYSYAMTSYILAEYPELSAGEAIARSKEMMYGNRWRLFCLQISFIGWAMLCTLTMGIGNLWLRPYRQAATAAFYREISGTARQEAPYEQPKEGVSWDLT